MKLYIITGASRGLGKSIFKKLNQKKNTVIDISRNSKEFSCDLANIEMIPEIMKKIFSSHYLEQYEQISLINNAGLISPISLIGQMASSEIKTNINVNLTAPLVLINEFIKQTASYNGKLKVINISSGVAQKPKVSWSAYSAAKSGIENLSECLRKELEGRCEVYCCNPGLIDTDMQREIRDTDPLSFPEVGRFKEFYENGGLVSPDQVAANILREANEFNH